MKEWILLLLCITGSVVAMELGQNFYVIHTFLQKIFTKKRQSNTRTPAHRAKKDRPKEIDLAHQAMRNYIELIEQKNSAGVESAS